MTLSKKYELESLDVGKVSSGFEYFFQTFVLLSGLTFQLLGLDAEFCALSISDRFKGVVGQKLGGGVRPKNHIKSNIFIEILTNIRLRIWVDLLN